ncbi:MAG: hypothetical protein HY423_01280 [Candidatus Lambdaproteobacteria bacterium]|nr:hypothetical protein [Candidatus Lambdaproteobacteria bacterium]
MNDKEKIDILLKQAEFSLGQLRFRQQQEWRLSLSFWGLIAVAVGFSWINIPGVPKFPIIPLLLFEVFVFVTYIVVWGIGIWKGNFYISRRAYHYRDEALRILANPNHVLQLFPFYPDYRFPRAVWYLLFRAPLTQVFVTFLLLAISFFILV